MNKRLIPCLGYGQKKIFHKDISDYRTDIAKVNNVLHYSSLMLQNAGVPVDKWGSDFEKMHPQQCRCAPCSALREVKYVHNVQNMHTLQIKYRAI